MLIPSVKLNSVGGTSCQKFPYTLFAGSSVGKVRLPVTF
jgi:hypothetical protein